VVGFNEYVTRSVDWSIVEFNNDCLIYAKFSRFMIFGEITELTASSWVGTKVEMKGGVLSYPQSIEEGAIGGLIIDRARAARGVFANGISQKQREMIDAAARRESPVCRTSDLIRP
jgi:hypothetical protein